MKAIGHIPTIPENTLALGDPALLKFSMAQAAKHYGVPGNVIPKRQRGKMTDCASEEARVAS